MPGRRRRAKDSASNILRNSVTDGDGPLAPTLNRFAEDTSMLGFRYLHTKYKTWFRIIWATVITFFLGLTIYQVVERIGYYFVRNPLNTQKLYDSPSRITFPTVLLCNKLQMKASRVAHHNPDLLRTMALMYNEDGTPSLNRSLADTIASFSALDFSYIFRSSLQKADDFILSCHYGRGQSCMDEIRPVVTPNGLCFAVANNITVKRPGPETTLSLLLNLETYDIIPGWVMEPGVVMSLYDRMVPQTAYSGEGTHLAAGKVVTIPVNDVRQLYRHSSKCGRISIGNYAEKDYSRTFCQWYVTYEKIAKLCGCLPNQSPKIMELILRTKDNTFLLNNLLSKSDNQFLINNTCSLWQEFHCVNNISKSFENEMEMEVREMCPEDCTEITYTTIVFGGNLDSNEIASYLPSDWDDDKEKRLNDFQAVIGIIPKYRIPLIQSIQQQAYEAQKFLDKISKLLSVAERTKELILPCLRDEFSYNITATIEKFHSNEPLWISLASFIESVFPFHIGSILSLLHTEVDDDSVIKTIELHSPTLAKKKNRKDLENKLYMEENDVDLMIRSINDSANVFDFHLLDTKSKEVDYTVIIGLPLTEMPIIKLALKGKIIGLLIGIKDCLGAVLRDISEPLSNNSATHSICAQNLSSDYEALYVGRRIPKILSMETFNDYADTVQKLAEAVWDLKWNRKPKIFHWRHHGIDLKLFQTLYMENGNDSKAIHEFLRQRKLIQSDMGQHIKEAVMQIESALEARLKFLEDLQLQPMAIDPINSIRNSVHCLQNLSSSFDALKKDNFLRAEWTSKLQRLLTVAKSYSVGKHYDEVNLLFAKIYFAHFKQEIITQERSYSLFLLLAEIGGTIGLYVGASLLTIAETAVFFIERKTRKGYNEQLKLKCPV